MCLTVEISPDSSSFSYGFTVHLLDIMIRPVFVQFNELKRIWLYWLFSADIVTFSKGFWAFIEIMCLFSCTLFVFFEIYFVSWL